MKKIAASLITLTLAMTHANAHAAPIKLKACLQASGAVVVKAKCAKSESVLTRDLLTSFSGVSAKGETGPQGIQGVPGATGPQGVAGPIGPQGQQGPAGITGIVSTSKTVNVPGAQIIGFPPIFTAGTASVDVDCPASHMVIGAICQKTASSLISISPGTPVIRNGGKGITCSFTNVNPSLTSVGEALAMCLPF